MNIQFVLAGIGFIVASILAFKAYLKVTKGTGLSALSKTSFAFRMIVGISSIALSIYGVYSVTYSFFIDNGSAKLIAISVSSFWALLLAFGMETIVATAEKALLEAWQHGIGKFASILAVVIVLQSINFLTIKANGKRLFNNIVKKESKIIDNVILDTSKDAIATNKATIERLQKEIASVSVDPDTLFKNSKGYAIYTAKIAKEERLANSTKLKELAKKGNYWAKAQIAKHKANAQSYKDKLKNLELKAKESAKAKELALKQKLQKQIDALVATNLALSKNTLTKRSKELEKIEQKARNKASVFTYLAFGIVFTSVGLSLIHTLTSSSALSDAKKAALEQKKIENEAQKEITKLDLELKKQEYISKMQIEQYKQELDSLKGEIVLSMPTNDNATVDQKNEDFKSKNEPIFGTNIDEVEVEEVDFNERLFEIASSAAIEGKHPPRDALKDLAYANGLDVTNWAHKYREYAKAMQKIGRIYKKDGVKGYYIRDADVA